MRCLGGEPGRYSEAKSGDLALSESASKAGRQGEPTGGNVTLFHDVTYWPGVGVLVGLRVGVGGKYPYTDPIPKTKQMQKNVHSRARKGRLGDQHAEMGVGG